VSFPHLEGILRNVQHVVNEIQDSNLEIETKNYFDIDDQNPQNPEEQVFSIPLYL